MALPEFDTDRWGGAAEDRQRWRGELEAAGAESFAFGWRSTHLAPAQFFKAWR
jgi:hypothetical protein